MNYEDKYNEILEWARKNKARLNGVPIEEVLPELAESEDEKTRKALIETVKCIYDGDTMFLSEQQRDRYIAWLEKQKENPKSADSIPPDCTSDVKCEDRWHKVGDSLPDNGRLVLAQDCLGNILLARYDGEGNWEVSVYDKDDYYCRNTITKWCEIPSEKQKEQKPWKVGANAYFTPEQKPAEFTHHETNESLQDAVTHQMEDDGDVDDFVRRGIDDIALKYAELGAKWQKEQKQEWSKKDEEILNEIITIMEGGKVTSGTYLSEYAYWLKSLRPSWKPSEEQMKALNALNLHGGLSYVGQQNQLISLYQQLKKLL